MTKELLSVDAKEIESGLMQSIIQWNDLRDILYNLTKPANIFYSPI